jgi:outer membrane protein assembly factor BamB
MRKSTVRMHAALVVGVVITLAGVAEASPSMAAAQSPAAAGAQLWVKHYMGPSDYSDAATSVAASPTGDTVFVTGASPGVGPVFDYATIAYDAATGAQLWARRYNGPGTGGSKAASVAVSPDGDTVFVTGSSAGASSGQDYATIAYDAATGAQLWVSRYSSPGNQDDAATSLVVSPSGDTAFVTGHSGRYYATVAYNAATGAQLWVKNYHGPGKGSAAATSVTASPDGDTVFVTGSSPDASGVNDYATLAYDAATGAQLWVRRYAGPDKGSNAATSVGVGPDGDSVFVTGSSIGASGVDDYATVAYDAATGAPLWVRRYHGPGSGSAVAISLVVSPSADTVFVTGQSGSDYATVAYGAATGVPLWVRRYHGPGSGANAATSVAVSPDGGTVFVTGYSGAAPVGQDDATIAYGAATGAQLWVSRYNGPDNRDAALSLVASPSGDAVFVTGWDIGGSSGQEYTTIAYSN